MNRYTTTDGKVFIAESDLVFAEMLRADAAHYPTETLQDFMRLVSKWSWTFSEANINPTNPTTFVDTLIDSGLIRKDTIQ